MNERITEIAEQCHHRYSEHNIDLDKFVELIVSATIQVIRDRKEIAIENEWNVDEAMSVVEADIEDYFGIE